MEKKDCREEIYMIIISILLALNIASGILFYRHINVEHGSQILFTRIHNYISFHNLNEEDYNFNKIFVGFNGNYPEDRLKKNPFIYLCAIYLIISMGGFLLYTLSILCFYFRFFHIINSMAYFFALVISIVEMYCSFGIKLTEKDLSDFGDINEDIRLAYDYFLEDRLYMKVCSIIFLISSLYNLISPFLIINNYLKEKRKFMEQYNQIREQRRNFRNNLIQHNVENGPNPIPNSQRIGQNNLIPNSQRNPQNDITKNTQIDLNDQYNIKDNSQQNQNDDNNNVQLDTGEKNENLVINGN